ncbi:uncharacterized protein [Littorina saxatilis]|uniref:Uncharacterized protein n=1 Tax=Littorina saxatilis TaxID=31220 RepID=A0AAN9BCV0_9CAEN
MSNCAVVPQLRMQKSNRMSSQLASRHSDIITATTTTISSERPGSAESNNENIVEAAKASQNWLSRVCRKLKTKNKRQEKCEKCGQRSDTCLPNASFISGRKHFLCLDCRASSDNIKNMYSQLCRNLSLREARNTHNSGEDAASSSSGSSVVMRSKSMKTRPTAPESGYGTATSCDSSSSNGRLVSTSSGECVGRCTPPHPAEDRYSSQRSAHYPSAEHSSARLCVQCPADITCSGDKAVCSRDKPEVFSGAFKSEKAHLNQLQSRPKQKVYTRPQQQQQHHTANPPPPYHHHHQKQHKGKPRYDGYLEVRAPNAEGVKYVFERKEQDLEDLNDEVQEDHLSRRRHTENLKQCYRCQKYRCVAFRAPFQKGWLCEDCMDDLM